MRFIYSNLGECESCKKVHWPEFELPPANLCSICQCADPNSI